MPKSLGAATLATLEMYHWPGNVRELENVLRRAIVVSKGPAILLGDLPPEIASQAVPAAVPGADSTSTASVPGTASSSTPVAPGPVGTAVSSIPEMARLLFLWAQTDSKLKVLPAVERALVVEALKETRGNQVQAARLLGITRATLRKRIEKFRIKSELVLT
jgi:two-component system nitrogen regulation response regulator GlnG